MWQEYIYFLSSFQLKGWSPFGAMFPYDQNRTHPHLILQIYLPNLFTTPSVLISESEQLHTTLTSTTDHVALTRRATGAQTELMTIRVELGKALCTPPACLELPEGDH